MRRAQKIIIGLIIFWGLFCISLVIVVARLPARQQTVWGVTFDPVYTQFLGLDSIQTFNKLVTEYKFRDFRLPIHWNKVETAPGVFDFSIYDPIIEAARKHEVKVVIAVGQKTPRWPECHQPVWATDILKASGSKRTMNAEYTASLHTYIRTVIERYKNNQAVEMWQVENEPFFRFGDCPDTTPEQLATEIALVKSLDPVRAILTTDSGELSTWRKTIGVADFFGTTMYRVVWNKHTGYISYNWLPAFFYRIKLWFFDRTPDKAFVAELQAEPWIPGLDARTTPLEEQYKSLDFNQLQKNIVYAKDVGFARTYLWGAEWWAWLENQGAHEIPNYIKNLPK